MFRILGHCSTVELSLPFFHLAESQCQICRFAVCGTSSFFLQPQQDKTRQDKTRQDKTRQKTRHDKARREDNITQHRAQGNQDKIGRQDKRRQDKKREKARPTYS